MTTKRVLVVDDQTPVRELVAAVLSADGHAVETARDGADALRILDGQPGDDLIVSDLKMPGLDAPSLYLETTPRRPRPAAPTTPRRPPRLPPAREPLEDPGPRRPASLSRAHPPLARHPAAP